MSDDGRAQSGTVWPLPKFYFEVRFDDGAAIPFQEVSGLDTEAQALEYRTGNAPVFSKVKLPGVQKSGNVTLKKGVFRRDNRFWGWYSEIKMNTIKRKNVTISLLDEGGKPTMVWHLQNAFPTKITGTDLKAEGNEIAVETIELAHEGIRIENG